MTLDWIVYYGDGSECTSMTPVEMVPTRDVQAVAMIDSSVGWRMLAGHDFYVWKNEKWWGVDQFGFWDYVCADGWKKVLTGRFIERREYDDIVGKASRDSRLPRKTAKARGEI